jgi:hypothetical protein
LVALRYFAFFSIVLLLAAAVAHSLTLGVLDIAQSNLFWGLCASFGALLLISLRGKRANFLCAALLMALFLPLLTNPHITSALGAKTTLLCAFCAQAIMPFNLMAFAVLPHKPLFSIGGAYSILFVLLELLAVVLLPVASVYFGFEIEAAEASLAMLISSVFSAAVLAIVAIRNAHESESVSFFAAFAAFFVSLYLFPKSAQMFVFAAAGALILLLGALLEQRPVVPVRGGKPPPAIREKIKRQHRSFRLALPSLSFDGGAFDTIIVHSGERYDLFNHKVNIVLSPAYYWYKRSDIAFKSLFSARKFAPSIFFSWVPEGKYRYYVFKETEGYGFIACDPDAVKSSLIAQGFDLDMIGRIYFAQCAIDAELSPVRAGVSSILAIVNGAWVALPSSTAENANEFFAPINTRKQPSLRISRSLYEPGGDIKDIKQRSFIYAAALLILLFSALLIDIFHIKAQNSRLQAAQEEILENAKLPSTLLQLESIEKRLNATASGQYAIREKLSKLLGSIQNACVESIEIKDGRIEAVVRPNFPDNSEALAGQLKTALNGSRIEVLNQMAVVRW